MGTAVDAMTTLVRASIPELSPVEWPNLRLVTYMDREYQEWAAELGKLPGPGWFTIVVDVVLAANATTIDLSTFINETSVGRFAAVKSAWYLPDAGEPQRIDSASPGQEEQATLPIGQSAVGQQKPRKRWLTRPAGVPTLNFGPVADVARNLRLWIRYKPPTLASGGTLQSDSLHDDVIVLGTALRCLLDSSETDPAMQSRYNELRGRFLEDERMAAGEHESETTKVVVSDEMFG